MNVVKRDGSVEPVNFNKITTRLTNLAYNIKPQLLNADVTVVAQKVVSGLYDNVTTRELDNLAAETAATMGTLHPDYDILASRIEVSNLHKETHGSFTKAISDLHSIRIISDSFNTYCQCNANTLNSIIDYGRDYLFDYFGIKTLKRSYLLKDVDSSIIERPQDMWMRVAAFIHQGDLDKIKETYDLLSQKYFTHATPTLFNAGTVRPQLSSCFLLDMADDSIEGIYKTLSDCAKISQSAGGIGLSINKIRSTGSYIAGTNGCSNGIVPMLRVYDATARYVDQGGGKRKGSMAIYIEPWHADIFEFLELKKNHGKEETRARDLFYGLWIPDLFMRRVEEDGDWTLFDPKKTPELIEMCGVVFNERYEWLEANRRARTIKARDLWDRIITSQIETGTPYMLYKDAANLKSNQQNLGTIKSSNLCTEIIEYTSPSETAVCNLASISLPAFCSKEGYDWEGLYNVVQVATRNLNKVIDITYYPIPEARNSNVKHRPIGIGVQGLADVFAILQLPFGSEEAKEINKKIFEVIYKAAVDTSIELARDEGTYESYAGSPASQGKLQFDLWGIDRNTLTQEWTTTFENLAKYGLRNSLLLAPMPTASTAQILGNNEAFEPVTSNIYTRRTLSGEFIVVNKYLLNELIKLGLWTKELRTELIRNNGSVQKLDIPDNLKLIFRSVWEIPMRSIIDMSADRGIFICQSQSLNLFLPDVTAAKLSSMHFYGWKKGLKTGMYYLRTQAAVDAIKFTIDKEKENESTEQEGATCSIDDPNCLTCSS